MVSPHGDNHYCNRCGLNETQSRDKENGNWNDEKERDIREFHAKYDAHEIAWKRGDSTMDLLCVTCWAYLIVHFFVRAGGDSGRPVTGRRLREMDQTAWANPACYRMDDVVYAPSRRQGEQS